MVEARRLIRASGHHVFAYLANPEHLPRYGAPFWMTADPAERRSGAHLVTLRGYFIGLPVESVLRVTLHPPSSMELIQSHGTLRAFAGRFALVGGEDGTEVRYRVETDPGIPMLTEDAARQFLVQHVERLLDRVKLAAERKAPSRPPRGGTVRPRTGTPGSAAAHAAFPAEPADDVTDEATDGAASEDAAIEDAAEGETEIMPAQAGVGTGPNAGTGAELIEPLPASPAPPIPPREGGQAGDGREARLEGPLSGRRRRRRRRRRHRSTRSPPAGPSASGAP